MKQRVLTGCIIAVFFAVMMLCIHTPFFAVILALLSVVSVYEIHKAAKIKNIPITVLSLIVSAIIPLSYLGYGITNNFGKFLMLFRTEASTSLIFYILAVLIFMLLKYDITKFEHSAISVFSALTVPYSYSLLLNLRDIDMLPEYNLKSEGIFFILLSFSCSWLTDVFAYFTGRAFGKHKLCPVISPKKTVEGALGGVLITCIINAAMLAVFNKFIFETSVIPYWLVIISSMILSVVSMCGDLSASTIKRNYGIKDFGKILPGHGGIMDRFDSCLFVWPCLYGILKIISIISEF